MTFWILLLAPPLILTNLLILLGALFSKKSKLSLSMTSPFECGFSPLSEVKSPICIHFFILGLVFLVFDTELIILFPFFLNFNLDNLYLSIFLFSILNALSLGLFYEWSSSMLEWLS